VQVRKGEKASWQTVTLVSATSATPVIRWAKGNIDYFQTFSVANAEEAEDWQIRAVAPETWKDTWGPLLIVMVACGILIFFVVDPQPRRQRVYY
jgi:hypothetical protein